MKKRKLYVALILFLATAIIAGVFVLSDLNKNGDKERVGLSQNTRPHIAEVKNDENTLEEKNSENIENGKMKKENSQEIDFQPIIDKFKGRDISKIKTDKKIVALTFDAGANADGVDKTLETLQKENIKGNFFLTGRFMEKYPENTQKIIDSGGDIGNHSYSHPDFVKISSEEIIRQIEKPQNIIASYDTKLKPFFRFPYGSKNSQALKSANDKNYIIIRWTIDSLGWQGTSGGMSADLLVRKRVISKTVPGAIIMMRLGSNPDDKTHFDSEALPEIIRELKKQEYKFLTLTEFFLEAE